MVAEIETKPTVPTADRLARLFPGVDENREAYLQAHGFYQEGGLWYHDWDEVGRDADGKKLAEAHSCNESALAK